jgi:2-haloacid dehalogenase
VTDPGPDAVAFEAVAFDLLTALVNSWPLWELVAGDAATGRAWRFASLRLVTGCGDYQPYEDLVAAAATEVGLPSNRAAALLSRWGELQPWPEAPGVLRALQGWRLVVVTNCSQRLAEQAAAATGCRFDVVMSAERAGVYKTDPRAYRSGLDALGVPAERVLFVAGSAHDVPGAGWVGMPVYWSNRQGLPVPPGPAPLVDAPNLYGLPALLGPAPASKSGVPGRP